MKRGKRLLAILLVLILSVSTAGCSKFAQQNQSASDTTSSKRIPHEDVKKKVINEASEYLKKNYGIQIDESRFTVFYEVFAKNLMPEITVMENQERVD